MGVYQDQGHFCRARWQPLFLTPFWILQLTLLLSMPGIFIYRLTETLKLPLGKGSSREALILQLIWEATNVALPMVGAGLTVAEILRFLNKNITPSWMVLSHISKTFIASIVLALDVTVYVKRVNDPYVTPGLAIGCALVLVTCVPATYVTVVYRRLLNHEYHHPDYHGFKKPDFSSKRAASHHRKAPSLSLTTPISHSSSFGKGDNMSGYLINSNEAGDPRWPETLKREHSFLMHEERRAPRLSLGSFRSLTWNKTDRSASGSPAAFDFIERDSMDPSHWPSMPESGVPLEKYTHERSTAFDEYIQRRLSGDEAVDRTSLYRPPRPSNIEFFSSRRMSSGGYSTTSTIPSPLGGAPRVAIPMPSAMISGGGTGRIASRGGPLGMLGSVPEIGEEMGDTSSQQQRHSSMGRIQRSGPEDEPLSLEPTRRVTIANSTRPRSKHESTQRGWPLRPDCDAWVPASAFDIETQPLQKGRSSSSS